MSGDDLNHYVNKSQITRAIVTGAKATALCGATWTPGHQGDDAIPGHEAASRRLGNCPECELFHSALYADHDCKVPEEEKVA